MERDEFRTEIEEMEKEELNKFLRKFYKTQENKTEDINQSLSQSREWQAPT